MGRLSAWMYVLLAFSGAAARDRGAQLAAPGIVMFHVEIGILKPEVRLRVPAAEDSLPIVRQAMRSLGETVDAEIEALEDAELAVTEAMANAVEHAYGGGEGDVHVFLSARDTDLLVTVRDEGVGMPEKAGVRGEGRGFGLAMIEGIASNVEIRGGDGTEVAMEFPIGRSVPETVDGGIPGVDPAERVLRRLVAVVAAQLDMSTERVLESLLVAELVARNALRYLTGDHAEIRIGPEGQGFELRVGPLEENGAKAVVADSDVPVVGSVVERLTDDVRVDRGPDGKTEHLALRIDPRG